MFMIGNLTDLLSTITTGVLVGVAVTAVISLGYFAGRSWIVASHTELQNIPIPELTHFLENNIVIQVNPRTINSWAERLLNNLTSSYPNTSVEAELVVTFDNNFTNLTNLTELLFNVSNLFL